MGKEALRSQGACGVKREPLWVCSHIDNHWVTHWASSSGSALVFLPLVDSTLFEYISQDPLVERVPYLCLSCIDSEGF